MNMPPFPTYIDSTMRATFVSCPQKFAYEYIHNLHPVQRNIHFTFGGAFAKGLEVFRQTYYSTPGIDKDTCLVAAIRALIEDWGTHEETDDRKTLPRCIQALVDYFDHYDPRTDHIQPYMKSDGTPAVELTFSIPLNVLHPDTGEPMLYCGRHDMLGTYGGQIYVVDEKTPKQLGQSWRHQWPLRSQFTGYCASAKIHGLPVVGAVVRGVGILNNRTTFEECITLRPDWQIERWYDQLERDVERMIQQYKSGRFDLNLDEGCSAYYSPCTFMDVCTSRFPEKIIEAEFVRRKWNPILGQEEDME